MKLTVGDLRGTLYRAIMRIAHHYNWHYAPPIYPEGDTQLWCKWCGFRQTISRGTNQFNAIGGEHMAQAHSEALIGRAALANPEQEGR